MSWAVVVPTCRPEKYAEFVEAWAPLFERHNVRLFPVHDDGVWDGIPDWIPRRTDMIRSWGFYLAWRDGADFILSLDDDVRPQFAFFEEGKRGEYIECETDIFAEYEDAFSRTWPCAPYLSVGAFTDSDREMRGFPYDGREARCMVQYGGWTGVLDYDGKTQLAGVPDYAWFNSRVRIPVPRGCAVTTCSMNMAWRREFTPCMWQLPVLGDRYKRFGDIWSGLIQKRVLDARGEVMLINGRASVLHERASDPVKNAELEAHGMAWNEKVWKALYPFSDTDIQQPLNIFWSLVWDLSSLLSKDDPEYSKHLMVCLENWLDLFGDEPLAQYGEHL